MRARAAGRRAAGGGGRPGGCGLWAGSVPAPVGPGSCANMLEGACQEQIDRAIARHPGATRSTLPAPCPPVIARAVRGPWWSRRANGDDGQGGLRLHRDPAPVPVPACAGMALDLCRGIADTTVDGLPPSKAIKAISIACTASSCTEERGEADVRVQFADGSEYRDEPAAGSPRRAQGPRRASAANRARPSVRRGASGSIPGHTQSNERGEPARLPTAPRPIPEHQPT